MSDLEIKNFIQANTKEDLIAFIDWIEHANEVLSSLLKELKKLKKQIMNIEKTILENENKPSCITAVIGWTDY